MEVWRVNKTKNYTVMSNVHLRDKELSLKAKGLMSVLLSLPDDWELSVNGLAAITRESNASVRAVLKELRGRGYIKVTKLFPNVTKSGRIEYLYDVFENPDENTESIPLSVEPREAEQANEPTQETAASETAAETPTEQERTETAFDVFWAAYPKKVAKVTAIRAWKRLNPSDELIAKIHSALEIQKRSEQWTKDRGRYVPNPATWLNGNRWEDDVTQYQQQKAGVDNGKSGTAAAGGFVPTSNVKR